MSIIVKPQTKIIPPNSVPQETQNIPTPMLNFLKIPAPQLVEKVPTMLSPTKSAHVGICALHQKCPNGKHSNPSNPKLPGRFFLFWPQKVQKWAFRLYLCCFSIFFLKS